MLAALLLSSAIAGPDAEVSAPAMLWSGCTWTEAPFEKSADVVSSGAREPVATVHGGGSLPVTLTGVLGLEGSGRTALSGVWSREGVHVAGWVDPGQSQVFRLSGDEPVDLGPAGRLVVGGNLDVVGFVDGQAVVRAHRWAREDVRRGDGVARVPCERISVTRGRRLDEAGIVEAALGSDEARVLKLAEGSKLKLRQTPDGPVVLKTRKLKHPRKVWIVEEADGWARIALPEWIGAVWYGWVEASDLVPHEGDDPGGALIGGMAGGGGEPIPIVRCRDPRILWAVSDKRSLPLGSVDGGVALPTVEGEAADGRTRVTVDGRWLSPREGWWLEIDERGCARGTREKPEGALDDLLEPDGAD